MRILIASFTYPPNKDGVSVAAALMTQGFLARGWEVEIATEPTCPARESRSEGVVRIHEFALAGEGNAKVCDPSERQRFQEFMAEGTWDVVVFHAYLWPLYLSLEILDQISARKVLVSHGYAALRWFKTKRPPWGLGAWLRSAARACRMPCWIHRMDRVVYLSERADFDGFFDHWIAKATNYKGRRVIPNGVDPDCRGSNPADFRRAHKIAPHQTLFLCVANYSRRKDQGFAARAFRQANLADAVLVFIGSQFNSDSARFQEEDDSLLSEQKAGRIVWLEGVSADETLNAFAACDAFILSADHEAQPIVLLEAMRATKPWIAREAGCIPELPGGWCVKSEQAMAERMKRLEKEPERGAKQGVEGRDAVRRLFNHQRYMNAYGELISELFE